MQERQYSTVGEATTFGIGSGIGWCIAIVAIAAIRERIKYSKIPAPLKGLGITFIITGLMGIAFMSFSGINLGGKKVEDIKAEPTTQVSDSTPAETSPIINANI